MCQLFGEVVIENRAAQRDKLLIDEQRRHRCATPWGEVSAAQQFANALTRPIDANPQLGASGERPDLPMSVRNGS